MLRDLPCHLSSKVVGACVAQIQKQSEERRGVQEGNCYIEVTGAGETAFESRRELSESGAWTVRLFTLQSSTDNLKRGIPVWTVPVIGNRLTRHILQRLSWKTSPWKYLDFHIRLCEAA